MEKGMPSLVTNLCGIELASPFILGSGPTGWDAEALAACTRAGAGAVVTKSMATRVFENNSFHMAYNGPDSIINNESGSDISMERWLGYDIPKAKELGVKVLIVSIYIYGPLEEVFSLATACEKAGADMLELVTGYFDPGGLVGFIGSLKKEVKLPIIAKVNGNWKNTDDIAAACTEAGADAISAIDSIGPVYRVNVATGRPLLGGKGYGNLTGAPIFPLALRFVHDIAKKSNKDIIGLGGVSNAETAMEMLMAGATACGICTAAILQGPKVFTKLCTKLSALMDACGYPDIPSISRKFHGSGKMPNLTVDNFGFNSDTCTYCKRCVQVCPYRARSFQNGNPAVDRSSCRVCGLCVGVCVPKAITLA
jgi:dihydroorotate dehydrogenase (fumarate)